MEGVMNPPARGPHGHPHPAGVDAGVITNITGISAPASAPAGSQVTVDVSVANITESDLYLAITANYDSTPISFQFDYLPVAPYQTVVFRGTFTMPNKSVRVTAWSWWWDGSKWVADDSGYVDIALGAVTPQFRGFGIADYSKV